MQRAFMNKLGRTAVSGQIVMVLVLGAMTYFDRPTRWLIGFSVTTGTIVRLICNMRCGWTWLDARRCLLRFPAAAR